MPVDVRESRDSDAECFSLFSPSEMDIIFDMSLWDEPEPDMPNDPAVGPRFPNRQRSLSFSSAYPESVWNNTLHQKIPTTPRKKHDSFWFTEADLIGSRLPHDEMRVKNRFYVLQDCEFFHATEVLSAKQLFLTQEVEGGTFPHASITSVGRRNRTLFRSLRGKRSISIELLSDYQPIPARRGSKALSLPLSAMTRLRSWSKSLGREKSDDRNRLSVDTFPSPTRTPQKRVSSDMSFRCRGEVQE